MYTPLTHKVLAIAITSVAAFASHAQTTPGSVLYRALTNQAGDRIGVEFKIVDADGLRSAAVYTTDVTPSLENLVSFGSLGCASTEFETSIELDDPSPPMVIGYVDCRANGRAAYWAVDGEQDQLPIEWTESEPFLPADNSGAASDGGGDTAGEMENGGIWLRSAAVLAGLSLLAIVGVGWWLYSTIKSEGKNQSKSENKDQNRSQSQGRKKKTKKKSSGGDQKGKS